MRLLLDTHVALWAITGDRSLSRQAHALITDRNNDIFVSVATLWEIAIKYALKRRGRGAMRVSAVDARQDFHDAGYALLPVTADHVCGLEALPMHHSDPFDRLLVAQATTEPMQLLTHDAKLVHYGSLVRRV